MGGAKATSSGSVGWRVADLLATKMEGGHFTEEQVACIIQMVTDGSMDDCQLGALLVAVKVFGMNPEEVVALTRYMRDSGRVFEWPQEWKTVDKHSTGGVGDKVSLPLVPSLAALGLHVPMISGRGLEHTGGTLDKLESIPGYRVALSEEEMRAALSEAGGCIVGQTSNITPADKRMYAARDITATVNSLPLIVSSIISKKAAGGMKALVLDVKYGDSAFMKTVEEARTLAKAMVDVSGGLGIKTTALVTEMSNPIGKAIGNALEVMEALECLRGQGPADLKELVVHLGGELVAAGGLASSAEEGQRAVERVLSDGSALASFRKMLVMQGVSEEVAAELCGEKPNYSKLPRAASITPVHAATTGVISKLDAMSLAKVCQKLGAGRERTGDSINLAVGIVLRKSVGEQVGVGEAWADIHHDTPLPAALLSKVAEAVVIEDTDPYPTTSRIAARVS
ncbi:thymidine phosphorylase-like isoform X1 [Portunus trituberculatus]|uniref:thymidine phosphorylase-like isoform X1 n=1 Tax=Portunus trituberculatus TaxID=210409 RepID=UPI001E1CBBC9|nr:thymidine phosphorylase-like isoform X1 [Portunus trituberculatus]